MSPVMLGGVEVSDVRVGGVQASAVYLGDTKVWPADTGGGSLSDVILSYSPSIYLPLNDGNADDASTNGVTTSELTQFPILTGAALLPGDTYSSEWDANNVRGIGFTLGGSDFPGPVTAICFVNVDDLNDSRTMWGPASNQSQLWRIGTDGIQATASGLNGWPSWAYGNTVLSLDTTYMLVYRATDGGSDGDVEFLLDNAVADGGNYQSPLDLDPSQEWAVGKRLNTTAAYTDPFSGRMAHFAIFPSYLDDTAIQAIYAASGLSGTVPGIDWELSGWTGSTQAVFAEASLVVFATGLPGDLIEAAALPNGESQLRFSDSASASEQLANNGDGLTTAGTGSSGFKNTGADYSYLSAYGGVEYGTYVGNGGTQQFVLPFTPGLVIIQKAFNAAYQNTAWITPDLSLTYGAAETEIAPHSLSNDTLTVLHDNVDYMNDLNSDYDYVAFPPPDVSGTYTGTGTNGPQTVALSQAVKFLLVMCEDENGDGPGMAWTFDAQYGDAGNYHRFTSLNRDRAPVLSLSVNADSFTAGFTQYPRGLNHDTATYRYYGWS